MSSTLVVHSLRQSQSITTIELRASEVVDKIQLTNRLAEVEKVQFLQWFEERYDELESTVGTAGQLLRAVEEGLSGKLSAETIQFIAELLSGIGK